MKVWSLISAIFLLCNGQMACADALSRTQDTPAPTAGSKSADFLKKATAEAMYGYTDFNFNSTQGENFNRFQGHSNLYSGGTDHITLSSSLTAGLSYFRVETALTSQVLLAPSAQAISDQTITNNTIFGHLLKVVNPQFYVDLAGGYGYNKIVTYTEIPQSAESALGETTPADNPTGHARNNNDNWFISLNGIYKKTWKKYVLRTNLGLLYSQVDTGSYDFEFPATNTVLQVAPLTNRSTLILENAELGYLVKPQLMPFINAGLVQVAQFSNSRPIIAASAIFNGSLPQLNMDKNGFRLGAGIVYTYKNVSMRLEEKYFNAGGTFQSNQVLASLKYQFS